jgi:hypothetical protein
MNKAGTIADITKWAESVLPGDEARARSVIVGCRKANLFTKGGHGRNAPFMRLTDFATAILAVLHPGQVTHVHEAVIAYWALPLTLAEIDDPDRNPAQFQPDHLEENEAIRPYFDRFNVSPMKRSNALIALTGLFDLFAPHRDFDPADYIQLETAGQDVTIRIVLHGGPRVKADGWPGSGPDHATLTLSYGALQAYGARTIKTTRTIYGDALNALSLMTPNLTKANT